MDFSKCQCASPGFCDLFKKNMGTDPPNWQWCQNITSKEREDYFNNNINTRRGSRTINEFFNNKEDLDGSKTFVTNEMLINDSLKLINKLPKIKAVLGCPRSGMIPASIISTALSIPLLSISDSKICKLSAISENGGLRMKSFKISQDLPILVIDDTVFYGSQMRKNRELLKQEAPNEKFIFASIYCYVNSKSEVDYYYKGLSYPHILEWNIFNSPLVKHMSFDIDGIFCENIPIDICKDEDLYTEYLNNIKPIYNRIPKLFKARALVTGRLEKYRDITEKWLEKYDFNYNELIMFPNELEEKRNNNHSFEVGSYKGIIMTKINEPFFVESELSEAKIIKRIYNSGTVICPNQRVCL